VPETVAIAGTGAIACGLAATVAANLGDVLLLARSEGSAAHAIERAGGMAGKLGAGDATIRVSTDLSDLDGETTYVVEAIVEDEAAKRDHLSKIAAHLPPEGIIATTTSSLSVAALAEASGRPEHFAALHVFNPVPKMALVEVSFPEAAVADTRARTLALCDALGKTAVEVPDIPGFVVNRLLFPYLFSAVRLMEETGMTPEAVDTCMTLGTGHPMGPLALLDFVGLDISVAIGESLGAEIPARLTELVAEGALGRKSGRGLYPGERRP
jgi:3-hydroxybutyryl-CoA dehydrogenase